MLTINFDSNTHDPGSVLKMLRTSRNKSQQELSDVTGYGKTSIARYEAGEQFSLQCLTDIANALGYDVSVTITERE